MQVAGDRLVAAPELVQRGRLAARAVAQRERGEREGGGPALGPVHQGLHVGAPERQPAALEQPGRLGDAHRQLGHADLGQRAARAQPAQRQRRLGARGDREPATLGQVALEGVEHLERLAAVEPLGAVDHEHERAARLEREREAGEPDDALALARAGAGSGAPDAGRGDLVERVLEVEDERAGVVAAGVAGDPRERPRVLAAPLAQQRRLAVAGRGDEDGDRRGGVAKPGDEVRTRYPGRRAVQAALRPVLLRG